MKLYHASIRFGDSDGATAAIVSGFLEDMISAGHLELTSHTWQSIDRRFQMARQR